MTSTVRTPDERFAQLPGWPYEPHYTEVAVDGLDLRLARVDEGAAHGHTVVLLHGEPTWSYLWRHVIAVLRGEGHRVVAPDLVGFGRSDKPVDRDWYSYARVLRSLEAQLDACLQDTQVTLVVHDWGGLLGLRWAVDHPDRVARLVITDTGLYRRGAEPSEGFRRWRDFVARSETLPVASLIQASTVREVPDEVLAAYEAPFHEDAAQAGALALPLLVPTKDDDPGAAEQAGALEALGDWERPTLVVWGEHDPIIPPRVGERFVARIPGAQPLVTLEGSHFLQEDVGEELGRHIARFVASTG